MRIFLSHDSADKPYVTAVQAAMPPHVRVWLDVQQLYAGHRLGDELRRAVLDENDYVVVFVSPRSLASEWVARELAWALEREGDLRRPFVVPVMLPDTALDATPPPAFAPLWQRIYLEGGDDPAEAGHRLAAQLFALASEWIELAGDSSRARFIARLRADLTQFENLAHRMLAALRNPIPVLATREDAQQVLIAAVDAYSRFGDALMGRLGPLQSRVRDLFGGNLAAEADRLFHDLEHKVYRGRLFALNDVVADINRYDGALDGDAAALAAAEDAREAALAAAEKALAQCTRAAAALARKLERE